MNSQKKAIAIVGPTGAGKTALAVTIAKKFDGVLISADSRQVYIGLDIGTNKEGCNSSWLGEPSREIDGVHQLLIDVAKPGERYTLADWLVEARRLVRKIAEAGSLAIIVGGTGLYVSALLDGYVLGEGRNCKKRQATGIDPLILEVSVNRNILNKKSNERYVAIFDALCAETNKLINSGTPPVWLNRIGLDYRWASKYLSNEVSRDEAISALQSAGRSYIRRQETWWRHHGPACKVTSTDEATNKTSKFLKNN